MVVDRFTKVIFLAIAILLGLLAFRPIEQHSVASAEQEDFSHVKPLGMGSLMVAFLLDTRTGDIWSYSLGRGDVRYAGKLTTLGKPLQMGDQH